MSCDWNYSDLPCHFHWFCDIHNDHSTTNQWNNETQSDNSGSPSNAKGSALEDPQGTWPNLE